MLIIVHYEELRGSDETHQKERAETITDNLDKNMEGWVRNSKAAKEIKICPVNVREAKYAMLVLDKHKK